MHYRVDEVAVGLELEAIWHASHNRRGRKLAHSSDFRSQQSDATGQREVAADLNFALQAVFEHTLDGGAQRSTHA